MRITSDRQMKPALHLVYFYYFQVPSAPPANVTAYNTSSVGIIVFWEQIPKAHRNGHVVGYKVCYKRADKNDSVLYCTAVFALGIELGGLNPYTPYWITVLGYTNKGEGPSGRPLQVWTDEFGKFVGSLNLKGQTTMMTPTRASRKKGFNVLHYSFTRVI